ELGHGAKRAWQPPHDPWGGEADPVCERERTAQRPKPVRVWEEREDAGPQGLLAERTDARVLDLDARLGHDPVVADAGRACGYARQAAEAGIEMTRDRRGHRRTLEHLLDQMDATARRVHLLAPELVGRAGGQAEATVDTDIGQRPQALVGHIPPTNR